MVKKMSTLLRKIDPIRQIETITTGLWKELLVTSKGLFELCFFAA